MNVTGPIRTIIAANGAANTIFSGRVYANALPQSNGTLPAATVTIDNVRATNTKTSASDLDFVSVQLVVVGDSYADAEDGAKAIRTAIDGYQGTVTVSGTPYKIELIEFKPPYSGGFDEQTKLQFVTATYSVAIRP